MGASESSTFLEISAFTVMSASVSSAAAAAATASASASAAAASAPVDSSATTGESGVDAVSDGSQKSQVALPFGGFIALPSEAALTLPFRCVSGRGVIGPPGTMTPPTLDASGVGCALVRGVLPGLCMILKSTPTSGGAASRRALKSAWPSLLVGRSACHVCSAAARSRPRRRMSTWPTRCSTRPMVVPCTRSTMTTLSFSTEDDESTCCSNVGESCHENTSPQNGASVPSAMHEERSCPMSWQRIE